MAQYETLVHFLSNHNKGRSDGQILMNFQKNSATIFLDRDQFSKLQQTTCYFGFIFMLNLFKLRFLLNTWCAQLSSVNGSRPPVLLVSYVIFLYRFIFQFSYVCLTQFSKWQ